jgi:hypothetical protein
MQAVSGEPRESLCWCLFEAVQDVCVFATRSIGLGGVICIASSSLQSTVTVTEVIT